MLMLPLFITLARHKTISHNKGFILAWLAYISAFIMRYMFEELGPRAGHGNASWGRHHAMVLLLLMSTIEINRMWSEPRQSKRDKIVFFTSVLLMMFYTISGLLYVALLLYKGTYYI